jgi:CubicO group peptidase (beta-lactamase class C family)
MTAERFRTAFVTIALLAAGTVFAQPPALTEEDLSAYLDGMLPSAMAAGDIAGAVVVVVKDDHVLLAKAYGVSDVEKRTPVSAEKTLFRPGSISKLFTWTAVMQLVEAGKVDLDHDINEYLDFKVTGYEGKPITLRNLMTHTPGLEERLKDLLLDDVSQLKPLDAVLKEAVPAAIYPPGTVPAYSNYGAALAGYIVQRVSGLSYDEYIEQKIFTPLGMHDSTFRQPVPEALKAQLSNGYLEASGSVVGYEVCPDAPAGALSASGTDMGKFMMAHLNGGALPGGGDAARILSDKTTELMHTTTNTPAPNIDAMALGFYEQNRNGLRAIAHGGDLTAFHSDLILIPPAKVGLFMSFNSIGRNRATYGLRTALGEGFVDRYFPRAAKLPAPQPLQGSKERAQAVAASLYELSRRAEKNFFSFAYMLGQTGASVTDKGTLKFDALLAPNEKPREFEEVTPWNWREVGGEMRLAAVRTPDGAIQSMVPDGYGPIFVFQPVPGWRSKSWLQPAVLGAGIVLIVFAGTWLIGAVRQRVRRKRNPSLGQAGPTARWLKVSRLTNLACLAFLLLIGSILMMFSSESFWVLTDPAVPFLRLVQLFGLLAVIGGIAGVFAAFRSWREPQNGRMYAIGRTLTALACLVCAYVALAFHFLSLRLVY